MSGIFAFAIAAAVFLGLAKHRAPALDVISVKCMSAVLLGAATAAVGAATDALAGILMAGVSVCAFTDASTGFVFDEVTVGLGSAIVVCAVISHSLVGAFLGACAGAAPFLALYIATAGRGVGLGDAKLSATIGLALGVHGAIVSVGAAFVAGAIVGCAMLVARRLDRRAALPFAPFLACGVAVTLLVPGAKSWPIG